MNRMLLFLTLWVSLLTGESIWLEDFSTAQKYTVTLGAEGHDGAADYFIRTDDDLGHLIGPNYSGASGYYPIVNIHEGKRNRSKTNCFG